MGQPGKNAEGPLYLSEVLWYSNSSTLRTIHLKLQIQFSIYNNKSSVQCICHMVYITSNNAGQSYNGNLKLENCLSGFSDNITIICIITQQQLDQITSP